MNPNFVWMQKRHLSQVLKIEKSCFGDDAWEESDFRVNLRCENVRGVVAEVEGEIVAYMIYAKYDDVIEVVNLGVATTSRRSGVATLLIGKLKRKLSSRFKQVVAIVREKNLSAQLFFQQLGFSATEVLKRHYKTDEDAYIMSYREESVVRNRIRQYLSV